MRKLPLIACAVVLTMLCTASFAQLIMLTGGGGTNPPPSSGSSMVWSATQINGSISGGGTATISCGAGCTCGPFLSAFGSEGESSGKYYWENTISYGDSVIFAAAAGVGNTSSSTSSNIGGGADTVGVYYDFDNGNVGKIQLYSNGSAAYTVLATAASGDRWANSLDLTNNKYWWKDLTLGTSWYGSSSSAGDPTNSSTGFDLGGTGLTVLNHPVTPGMTFCENGDGSTIYASSSSWTGTAPSGYSQFP